MTPSTDLLRTFIAIPVPTRVRDYLIDQMGSLKRQAVRDRIRWVGPEGLHLTLLFLGDTSPEHPEQYRSELSNRLEALTPFDLELGDTGTFPHANRPRVFWIGLESSSTTLVQLKQSLDTFFGERDYAIEKRRFHPHITLGRVKYISPQSNLVHTLLALDTKRLRFAVQEVVWYQSILHRSGAEYRELQKFTLGREATHGR